eukprot:1116807-Lingulodinium_polyedra.AAC.1
MPDPPEESYEVEEAYEEDYWGDSQADWEGWNAFGEADQDEELDLDGLSGDDLKDVEEATA